MIERILRWADEVHGMRSACLRYFNAAGAHPEVPIGEDHAPETHLIPIALEAVLGHRSHVEIFGDDYDTPDGTCIRDYIHVCDLSDAHIRVLDALDEGSCRYNVGIGRGYSVREVLESVRRVTGDPLPTRIGPRRPGDPRCWSPPRTGSSANSAGIRNFRISTRSSARPGSGVRRIRTASRSVSLRSERETGRLRTSAGTRDTLLGLRLLL